MNILFRILFKCSLSNRTLDGSATFELFLLPYIKVVRSNADQFLVAGLEPLN